MNKIKIGQFNTLRVLKKVEHGFYLQGDEEWNEILLPRKLAEVGTDIDDEVDVFIYFDSKDMIVATPQKPIACVGEFALLEVSTITDFGVFLDWGLDKDLFVPLREQLFKMTPGESYAVFIYIDKSGRIAASTRLSQFIDKSEPPYNRGDEVELLTYQQTNMGVKAIIDGQYSGVIYTSDIRTDLAPGQMLMGYIDKVRDDFKIDLNIHPTGLRGRKDLSEQILDKIKDAGGSLPVTSKTQADVISELFGVSRKKFKVALGLLYKNKQILIEDDHIRLNQED